MGKDKSERMPGFVARVDCCVTCVHSHIVNGGYEMPHTTICLHGEDQKVVEITKNTKNTEEWPWAEEHDTVDEIVYNLSMRDESICGLFQRREE